MSMIKSKASNRKLLVVYEIQCKWKPDDTPLCDGRLVLLRDRQQLFFYSRDSNGNKIMEVIHVQDITFVKVSCEAKNLNVYTFSREYIFLCDDAKETRQMSCSIKGELSVDQLRQWLNGTPTLSSGDALTRTKSVNRVAKLEEKQLLQRSFEDINPSFKSPESRRRDISSNDNSANNSSSSSPIPPRKAQQITPQLPNQAKPTTNLSGRGKKSKNEESTSPPTPPPEPESHVSRVPSEPPSPALQPKNQNDDKKGYKIPKNDKPEKLKKDKACQRCHKRKIKARVEMRGADGKPQSMMVCRHCVDELTKEINTK